MRSVKGGAIGPRPARGTAGGSGARAGPGPEMQGSGGRGGAGKGPGGADPKESRDEAMAGEIRALYLLLARALHPDKESDPGAAGGKDRVDAKGHRRLRRAIWRGCWTSLRPIPWTPWAPICPRPRSRPCRASPSAFAANWRPCAIAWRSWTRGWNPLLASLMKKGAVNETAYSILLSQVRKELKFMKQRRDIYRTTQGVHGLVEALRAHPWRELM